MLLATGTQSLRHSFNNVDEECHNLFCKLFLLDIAEALTEELDNLGYALALSDCFGIHFNRFAKKFCECDGDVSVNSCDEVFLLINDHPLAGLHQFAFNDLQYLIQALSDLIPNIFILCPNQEANFRICLQALKVFATYHKRG